MANTKYSIFVGSTFEDLKEERWEAMKAILKMKHIPLGMEFFPGTGEDQFEYIKKVIDDCDYYLILLGGKYGTIRSGGDLSYTEMEYDYAKDTGKGIVGVVYDTPESISDPSKKETDPEMYSKFCAFRKKIRNGLVEHWHDVKDIRLAVTASITDIINEKPSIGWVRGDEALTPRYNSLVVKYNSALEENKKLKESHSLNASMIDGGVFASLSDNHTIDITYFINPSYDVEPNRSESITKTISELFMLIGRLCLRHTPTIDELKKHVEAILREELNTKWGNPDEPQDEMVESLSVVPRDFEELLTHFELLELIDSYGGEGTIFLSEKGKNYYLANAAIKKKPPQGAVVDNIHNDATSG